jgi:hypothetical protein
VFRTSWDQVFRSVAKWFDDLWHYRSLDWAGAALDEWCVWSATGAPSDPQILLKTEI